VKSAESGLTRMALGPISRVFTARSASLMLALVALFVYLSLETDHYFTSRNLINLLQQMTPAGIAALGTALLIITGNVDLSIGSIFGLAAVCSAMLAKDMSPGVAIGLGVAIAAFCGLVNGVLVWRIRVSPIIVTLGTLTVIRAIVLLLTQGEAVVDVPSGFGALGSFQPFGIPVEVYIMLVGAVIVGVVLARTTIGLRVYAIGGNREAAEMAGVPVRRLVLGAFLFNGAMVGLAGVLSASRFGSADPSYGVSFELTVLTTVILGGVAFNGGEGSIFGALLGVAFITVVNSALVALGINAYWGMIVQGGALVVAVALDQLVLEQRERHRRMMAIREEQEEAEARRHASPDESLEAEGPVATELR
jgi:ribose/xylose/arabinose/galactoside ABC-type transport system permease subunit